MLELGPSLVQLDGAVEVDDGIVIVGVGLAIDSPLRGVPFGGRLREDCISDFEGDDGLVRDGDVVRLLRYEPAGDAARRDPLSAERGMGTGDSAR